jgi:hypothetical protein
VGDTNKVLGTVHNWSVFLIIVESADGDERESRFYFPPPPLAFGDPSRKSAHELHVLDAFCILARTVLSMIS